MVIDLDKCVGCQACTVACWQENNTPFAGPELYEKHGPYRTKTWNKVFSEIEGHYPEVKMRIIPRPCMHCDNAPCVKVCPVGATYKDDDGIIRQRYYRCIGCRYCMVACPYNARSYNWSKPKYVEPLDKSHNPDGYLTPGEGPNVRPPFIVEKCTFCLHRLTKAKKEGKPIGSDYPNGVVPACVQTCTGFARYFGDLDDPKSIVSKLAKSPRAFVLLEELGTKPKVIYLREG